MDSVYDQWADIYDSIYSYVTNDIPFYVEEARSSGGPVLELGCGTGRVTLPIAEAGIEIVGLDSSSRMLDVAREKHALTNKPRSPVTFVEGDMRDFDLGRKFSLIIIPFRGFLALLNVSDQVDALVKIRDHLSPGGRLILNVFVPDIDMLGQVGDTPYHLRDVTDPATGVTYVLWQQSSYDIYNQLIHTRLTIETLDMGGVVVKKMYKEFQLRYAHRWELHHLLRMCGFHVVDVYGDFDRSPLDETSAEMIWIAQAQD